MASSSTTSSTTETSWLYRPVFPESWDRHVLYSLATWINGMAFKNINFSPTGRPVIKIAEIKNGITEQTQFTDSEYDQRYFVTRGEMLFSWSGQPETSIDAFYWEGPDGWLNQHVFKVLPNTTVCTSSFLYYVLKYLRPNFIGIARNKQTTGLGHVTKADLEAIQVAIPDRPTQDRITHVLGKLDARIELNRRMNETLEGMARAIFKSWFVDFDPVRANMQRKAGAGTQRKGAKTQGRQDSKNTQSLAASRLGDFALNSEIAALFPDSFEDTPLGKIPKGWKVESLSDHVEAVKGLSYKGSGLTDSGTPLHNLNSVFEGGGYKHHGIKFYSGEFKERHIVRPGDVIVTNTEQGFEYLLIGYPAIVPHVFGDWGLFSHHLYRVRPLRESPLLSHFLYHLLMGPIVREQVVGCSNGTTVNMLPADGLQRPQFCVPPKGLIERFDQLASALWHRSEQNLIESRSLASIRDNLLPKLLSGEIRVPEAEQLIDKTMTNLPMEAAHGERDQAQEVVR